MYSISRFDLIPTEEPLKFEVVRKHYGGIGEEPLRTPYGDVVLPSELLDLLKKKPHSGYVNQEIEKLIFNRLVGELLLLSKTRGVTR